jgi:hypothetical protein
MLRHSFLAAIVLPLLFAPAAAHAQSDRQCMTNYQVQGSFVTPRTFRTHGTFEVDPDTAFQRVYANVMKQGFAIDQVDKDARILVALNEVGGSHRRVPLNVVVEGNGQGGSEVSIAFTVDAGMAVGKDSMQAGFCEILNAVNR